MKLPIVVLSLTWMINPVRAALVSEHLFGGSGQEAVRDVLVLPDGGLLLAGSVAGVSTNGNRTAAGYGGRDFWLMRLNTQAQPVWDTAYGGDDTDELRRALPLRSGGFLLIGSSLSPSGGTRTAASLGGADAWVTLVDPQGTPVWDRAFGGDSADQFIHGIELADGGFLLVGASSSQPGPGKSSGLYGETDGWVVRLDAQGNRLWDRSYGGTFTDELHAIVPVPDGGCYVAGFSDSRPQTGNKTSPAYGFRDVWVLRLNATGEILWEKSLGGSSDDWAADLVGTADGGLLVVGNSLSFVGGTKASTNYSAPGSLSADGWLNRLDPSGILLWDRSYGGAGPDLFRRALAVPGGFVFAGHSASPPGGTKTSPAFGADFLTPDGWFARVDAQGVPIWDFSFGASAADEGEALAQLPDGSYFLVGRGQEGTNGNRTLPGFGGDDGYAVRLASDEGRLTSAPHTAAEIGRSGFRFTLVGQSNLSYRIERSPNLINWGLLSTQQAGGAPLSLTDWEATNVLRRFYRARLVPAP